MCDLAGAERAGKTHGSHDRLKEAGNINSSLLVLSRCIEALRYGFPIVNLFIVCVYVLSVQMLFISLIEIHLAILISNYVRL